jgi:hypothetical protein
MHPTYNRAVEERTYHNRAVDDAHAWLVDHAQGSIVDPQGVPIPVDFYLLNRMRTLKARYGDPRINNGKPSDFERLQMAEYDTLMNLYANRPSEVDDAPNVGGLYLAVCIIAVAVLFVIGYGLWRWLN